MKTGLLFVALLLFFDLSTCLGQDMPGEGKQLFSSNHLLNLVVGSYQLKQYPKFHSLNGLRETFLFNPGDLVVEGNVGIGTSSPSGRLAIFSGNDVQVESSTGYIVLGDPKGNNIGIDENEIMARSSSGQGTLNLQIQGGSTHLGGPIDLNRGVVRGTALRVNERETIWFDGNQFSWGGGGSSNFFGDKVGIGVSFPTEKLEVDGNLITTGNMTAAGNVKGNRVYVGNQNQYFSEFGTSIATTANLVPGIGTPRALGQSSYPWSRIYLINEPNVVSDLRLKNNISPIEYGIKEILKLEPISYSLKSDSFDAVHLGLGAQDVLKTIPEVVSTHHREQDQVTGEMILKESETLSIQYGQLIPVLIKAVQEQQDFISSQNDNIKRLSEKLDSSKETNRNLEKRILEIEKTLQSLVEEID